jgi:hypothetical protein
MKVLVLNHARMGLDFNPGLLQTVNDHLIVEPELLC